MYVSVARRSEEMIAICKSIFSGKIAPETVKWRDTIQLAIQITSKYKKIMWMVINDSLYNGNCLILVTFKF